MISQQTFATTTTTTTESIESFVCSKIDLSLQAKHAINREKSCLFFGVGRAALLCPFTFQLSSEDYFRFPQKKKSKEKVSNKEDPSLTTAWFFFFFFQYIYIC